MPSELRIRDIETIPLRVQLPRVYRGSRYHMTHRCTIITRLITEDGVVGEIYNGDEDETQAEILRIIQTELKPLLVGRDAFNVEGCWEAMLPPTYDILRDRKLVIQAMSYLDSAIWDAVGKALKCPLHRIWGGYRDRLPIIAIGGYYGSSDAPDQIGAEMEWYRRHGLAGCKFKVGGLSPTEDAARVRVARAAAGPDFILAVDANQGWTTREAIEFARLVENLDIRWFEEPCRWYDDRRALRDVRMIGGIPVTAGQSEVGRAGCRDLMAEGAIDVCNFDSSWGGGPTEWRRVAGAAMCYSVQMGHHEEPQTAAHLLSAIPHGTYVECFHPDRDPLFWQLIANRPEPRGGWYAVPDGPGFGVQLDRSVVEKYRVDR